MHPRTKEILIVAIPTLLALLAALMMSQVYVDPLVFPDTNAYLSSALNRYGWLGYRPPAYGWLLAGAMKLGGAHLLIKLQILSWIACIAASTLFVLRVTKREWCALLIGVLLVLSEISMMHLFPTQWFLLADPLYADWVALGLVLIALGGVTSNRVLIAGALLVGLANPIRPLMVALPVAAALIAFIFWMKQSRVHAWHRWCVFSFTCLLVPSLLFSAYNRMSIGTYRLSPLAGLHMSMFASLADADDVVFDDPELNGVFHEILSTGTVPQKYAARDPFYLQENNPWHPFLEFYSFLAGEDGVPQRRYDTSRISRDVALRIIAHHPREYAQIVLGKWLEILTPTSASRDFFWRDPIAFYNRLSYHSGTLTSRTAILGQKGLPHLERLDERMIPLLNVPRTLGIRLPKEPGPKTMILLIGGTFVAIMESIRRLQTRKRHDCVLAALVLACLASTFLHALAQALVTLIEDPRFTLPGVFTGELAALLTFLSLVLPHPLLKTSAETHGRRAHS